MHNSWTPFNTVNNNFLKTLYNLFRENKDGISFMLNSIRCLKTKLHNFDFIDEFSSCLDLIINLVQALLALALV